MISMVSPFKLHNKQEKLSRRRTIVTNSAASEPFATPTNQAGLRGWRTKDEMNPDLRVC